MKSITWNAKAHSAPIVVTVICMEKISNASSTRRFQQKDSPSKGLGTGTPKQQLGMFYLHADNELCDLNNGSFNAWICHLCRALEWLSWHLWSEAAAAPDLCRQPGSRAGCSAICAPSPGSLPGFPGWLLSAASAEAGFPLLINAGKDALGSWLSSLERRGIWAPFPTWKFVYTYKL